MRNKQHKRHEKWFNEVSKIYISDKYTRNEAHIYEINLIANENPKYNIDFKEGGVVNINLPYIEFTEFNAVINVDMRRYKKELILKQITQLYKENNNINYISNKIGYNKEHTKRLLFELNLLKPKEKNKDLTDDVYKYIFRHNKI
jgi:hypothetical protein